MTDLIAKLEQAEAGSRELSDEVLLALGWRVENDQWGHMLRADGTYCHCREKPHCTGSVDDALALVPEGWHVEGLATPDNTARAANPANSATTFLVPDLYNDSGWDIGRKWAKAATPALALCIAILRATNTEGEQ